MENNYFEKGAVKIGDKEVSFAKRSIQGGYSMYVPVDFFEDKNFVSNYTYLFSKDKSPLSIAVRFTAVKNEADKKKMISNYFSQTIRGQELELNVKGDAICYRESVTDGKCLSVYSLRFTIDTGEGVLFGCFNCSADYSADWHGTVIEILKNVDKNG